MKSRYWLTTLMTAGLVVCGCDRPERASTAPASQPAVQSTSHGATADVATTANASEATSAAKPAATRPATSEVAVQEAGVLRSYEFPRARLHIDKNQKTAVLYSNDPEAAINAGYNGNSYYLVIPLEGDALDHLDGYEWHYKSTTSEHQDAADGIFLDGQRYHLQPSDMIVAFQGDGPTLKVGVNGFFFKFDTAPGASRAPGVMVNVNGIVNTSIDVTK